MEKLKQRFSKHSVLDDVVGDTVQDEQESILADDSDAFRQSLESDSYKDMTLRLKLSESENNICDEVQDSAVKDGFCSSGEADSTAGIMTWESEAKGQTVFEIISTETVKDGSSNFVIYRVLLTRPSVVDNNPCIVEKRYSEFEKLHSDLKKIFGKKMDDIAFPKKKLLGNFTPKTIGKRSRAFEQYLTHLYSLDEFRFSHTFLQFFYMADLKAAYAHLLSSEFTEAVSSFQKVLLVQERIIGYNSIDVGITLCALVVSCQASDKEDLALAYGNSALNCFKDKEDSMYYLPLLQTCVHLSWKLGKDKKELEETLLKNKRDSKELPSLMSVVQGSLHA